MSPSPRTHWSASFKHVLEPSEVGCDGSRVSPKVLVAHARGAAQREHHLADMPGFQSHGATMPDASGIVIVRNGHAQDRSYRGTCPRAMSAEDSPPQVRQTALWQLASILGFGTKRLPASRLRTLPTPWAHHPAS